MARDLTKDNHYIGNFIVNGQSESGQILHNVEQGLIILNFTRTIDHFGETFDKIPYITGKLNNGAYVTLFHNECINNHTHFPQFQTVSFRSKYLVWSINEAVDKKYNKLICIVENALLWSGLTRISSDIGDDTFKINHEDCSIKCNWFGYDIKFSTYIKNELGNSPRKEKSEVTEYLRIEIVSTTVADIETFINIRDKVLSLISFAVRNDINIISQVLLADDEYIQHTPEFKESIEYHLFTTDIQKQIIPNNIYDFNFTLKCYIRYQ